jgi:hypothetical protein
LPIQDPDRLARLWEVTRDGDPFSFSDANYLDLQAATRTLVSVAAYRELGTSMVLSGGGESLRIAAVPIAATSAQVLGVPLRDVDAELPVPPVQPIGVNRASASAGQRFNMALLAGFAGIALALAVSGVYAMLAFGVAERRREIAVRLALGASADGITALILGAGLALAGVAVGTAAAGACYLPARQAARLDPLAILRM